MNISSQTISLPQANVSVLGCATAEVVSPQLRLQVALVQCVSSVPFISSTGMAGICASGSFQLTPPPAVRPHLPTNLVTKKANLCLTSPPPSDRRWCSLGHLVT